VGWDYELFPQFYEGGSYAELRQRFTQEFRFVSSKPDNFIDYVGGAFYRNLKYQEVDNYAYAPGLPDFLNELYFGAGESSNRPDDNEFIAHVDTESTELAIFGEITFNLTDRWDVILGGRWFDFETDGYVDIASPMFEELLHNWGEPGCAHTQGGIDPTLFPCTFERNVMDNSLSDFVYKINTSYQFDRADALVFATIAEGYRPGGANFSNASWGTDVESHFYGYDPDKATSYELGVKSMWLDDRLRLNASVYHIDWEGIQLGTRIGAGFPAIVNGDDARINGIEIDLTASISDSLRLDLSVTRLDAELAEDTLTTPEMDGQKGDRLPGSAETQAILAVQYETEFANALRWWIRAAGSYSGDVTSHLNSNQFNRLISPIELSENRFFDRMPSYTVWNLSSALERDDWSLFAYIDNLFDEKYIVGTSTFELGPVDDPISREHYYGRPRTVEVGLRYTF
jgi:outer membrane receptor protein involved in Fe transport